MHKLTLLSAAAAFAVGSGASAQVVFDFNDVADNGDGTFSNLNGFETGGNSDGTLALSTAIDGTTAISLGNDNDSDGSDFSVLFQNFTSSPVPGSDGASFNALLEGGGTLSGQAIIVDSGTGDDDGAGQIYVARNGTNTPFDLTDGDGNFNFSGNVAEGEIINFSFELPNISGVNELDSGGFYGIQLGASDLSGSTADAVVVFDNIVFTPIPEPTSLGLLGLGGLALVRRRR